MHIGFQRSGGRGEYEVVGNHSGFSAIGLEAWTFHLSWPDGVVRDTNLILEPAESGKPRLRSVLDQPFQIGRQVAGMLLLPDPRREYAETLQGLPVARYKGFVLSRLGFGPGTEFSGIGDIVTIDPTFIDIDNLSDKETIGVKSRWDRISAVYSRLSDLPRTLANLMNQHREFMASGQSADASLTSIVTSIVREVPKHISADNSDSDPLPGLEAILGITPPDGPTLPAPDEIGEEEPLVSARAAHQYRLQKVRGKEGRRFSADVRSAYGNRCAFCGARFGGVRGIPSGLDAAHILAWSRFDLDVVQNGISLCKVHHWAFDAALVLPVYRGDVLTIEYTELAADNFDPLDLSRLGRHQQDLELEWLPASRDLWPSKDYLVKLYADLGINFAS